MIHILLEFDYKSSLPLYRQLYETIIREIKADHYQENDKMPSKRDLAESLKISENTVDTAYQMLVTEGYLRAVPKSGFYVCRLESLNPMQAKKQTFGQEKQQGKKNYLYDFSPNTVDLENFPFRTWAKISKDIMYNHPDLLNHGDRQGDECLRSALAKYLYEFRAVQCDSEQIIIAAGIEYLLMILNAILPQETAFAIENPAYLRAYYMMKSFGRQIRLINVDKQGMKVDQLRSSGANIAYVTPSHQFPTGVVMPVGRRTDLLKWANEKKDRYIIEDDYDSEFGFSGKPIPALQGLDYHGKVIYLGTFSRSIAPSIRISYMVLPDALLQQYRKQFSFHSATVSRFEQHTLSRFIVEGYLERHLNRSRKVYKKKKEALIQAFKRTSFGNKIKVFGDEAGLHFLLKIQNGMSEQELLQCAEDVGIKINGISDFYITEAEGAISAKDDFGRILFGYSQFPENEIEQAMDLFEQAWGKGNR